MATNLITFKPTVMIHASAASPTDHYRRKRSFTTAAATSGGWWAPLFGWSSEADYIEPDARTEAQKEIKSEKKPSPAAVRSRFAPGCFTEEKARRLRMLTKETTAFHDAMYHSAIASRLALDYESRFEQ